jgi:beta-lactamase superfamily II metal-dependent hydrolase
MNIRIFDVSHGFCALMVADNGNVMLVDCGHNERTGFRPSNFLRSINCTAIEKLVIQNYDQDHISDLPNIYGVTYVQNLHRNKSIAADQLEQLKLQSGPLTQAMDSMIGMVNEYTETAVTPPVFPNTEFSFYYHNFPTFTDTNNLSVVTFVHYASEFTIVFTGDLERSGWQAHLGNQYFLNDLSKVNVFVASHHGRETGYCEEVFSHCSPDIIVISDKEIVHETQKQNYTRHASGILWNGGPERRYVLTTRSDGMITIEKSVGIGYHVSI